MSKQPKISDEPLHILQPCGLCGKTGRTVRAECCGNWICDDESEYRLFSYAQNSCSRNHRRMTLCGSHHAEGHEGGWQDCPVCREDLSDTLEMYVWYGTNRFNFEKLRHPPAFKPTFCSKCHRRIILGEEGHTRTGNRYLCERCMPLLMDAPAASGEDAGRKGGAVRPPVKKGGRKVAIDLDREEYRRLVELVFLGAWFANAFRTDDVIREYEEAEQMIYSRSPDFDSGDLVEYSDKDDEWWPTRVCEDKVFKLVDEYNNESFFEELVHGLARRDMLRAVGKRKALSMAIEDLLREEEPYIERYEREVDEHGVERLEIVERPRPVNK